METMLALAKVEAKARPGPKAHDLFQVLLQSLQRWEASCVPTEAMTKIGTQRLKDWNVESAMGLIVMCMDFTSVGTFNPYITSFNYAYLNHNNTVLISLFNDYVVTLLEHAICVSRTNIHSI